MAKLIFVAARRGAALPLCRADIDAVCARLAPDNVEPRPPRIIEQDGTLIGIMNPPDSLPIQGTSVCLGKLFEQRSDWWRPRSPAPDGSYALFRAEGDSIELLSDAVGSRTIWYASTPTLFVASTSQRAVVCCLQSYEPDERVYPWLLSSGTLGPGLSWDRRISCLMPDSRLKLDRRTWQIEVTESPTVFAAAQRPEAEHERSLRDAMEDTFRHLRLDDGQWRLPLSGGYDSRAILLMLQDRTGLETLTWGMRSALEDRRSDAWVARELARRVDIEHRYFETDFSEANETASATLRRFIRMGEGRTDHLSGYMDGFAIWKHLYESGCSGILRGDEAFGAYPVVNDREVYRNMSLLVLSDYSNRAMAEDLAGQQRRPERFERHAAETREQWRDRVNLEFEHPFIFAALNDLKLAYVEVAQPLLSRRIVRAVRALPDELRTDKSLFRRIVTSMAPDLGFATRTAVERPHHILAKPPVAAAINEKLSASAERGGAIGVLSKRALAWLDGINPRQDQARTLLRRIRTKARLPLDPIQPLEARRLAFRAYIIAELADLLSDDAQLLQNAVFAAPAARELTA